MKFWWLYFIAILRGALSPKGHHWAPKGFSGVHTGLTHKERREMYYFHNWKPFCVWRNGSYMAVCPLSSEEMEWRNAMARGYAEMADRYEAERELREMESGKEPIAGVHVGRCTQQRNPGAYRT
jgi:hypothetical protein